VEEEAVGGLVGGLPSAVAVLGVGGVLNVVSRSGFGDMGPLELAGDDEKEKMADCGRPFFGGCAAGGLGDLGRLLKVVNVAAVLGVGSLS